MLERTLCLGGDLKLMSNDEGSMTIHLHIEKPSTEDSLDGKNHNNIAARIADTLEFEDVNIIGVEGPLGSGKSTVIRLLENELSLRKKNYQFINFDVEQYQQGSTKKALITKIYEGMYTKVSRESRSKFEEHKDRALGNLVTYKKSQDSEINFWTVAFIASVFLMTQTIRPWYQEFSRNDGSIYLLILFYIFLFSPLLVLIFYKIWSFTDSRLTIGNLIKKNTTDTITEKMLISKDIGSIELQDAVRGFKDCLPPGVNFILIIDNLDRVPSDKAKEIWSDIDLISNSSEKKLKLIIPYSAIHVAKALSKDDIAEGLEFISKRIPISFRIPPILSAGWRNAFSKFWCESFDHENQKLSHDAAELIEIWLPINQVITPRYLKKLINDIQITMFSTPFSVKSIMCLYYILAIKQTNIEFNRLTLDKPEAEIADEDELQKITREKIFKTNRKLQRIYNSDKQKWIDEILCINYQTNPDLARCELIDEPLKIALKQNNSESFIELSKLFGFRSSWTKLIDNEDPSDWITVLSKLPVEYKSLVNEILPLAISSLDILYQSEQNSSLNTGLLEALALLHDNDHIITDTYINKYSQRLKTDLINAINKDDEDEYVKNEITQAKVETLLDHCNIISHITKTNLLTEAQSIPTAAFTLIFLINNEKRWPHLEIDKLKLTPKEFVTLLSIAIENDIPINLTNYSIDRHSTLENKEIEEFYQTYAPTKLVESYNNLLNNALPTTLLSMESLVLFSKWHNTNLAPHYKNMLLHEVEWKDKIIAFSIAQSIETNTGRDVITDIISTYDYSESNVVNALVCYFKYISSFEKIIKSFEIQEIKNLISQAIEVIAINKSLNLKNNKVIFSKLFKNLSNNLSPTALDELIIQNANGLVESIETTYIKNIDEVFISHIINENDKFGLSKSFIHSLEAEVNDKSKFNTCCDDYSKKHESIIKYAISINHSFAVCKDFLVEFYKESGIEKTNSKLPRIIFDTFTQKDKDVTARTLSDLLYDRGVEVKCQVNLLKHFHDVLSYDDEDSSSGSRSISRLFEYIDDNPFLIEWLDKQNINFKKWNRADKDNAITSIISNVDLFPVLSSKSSIRSKIDSIKNE